MFSRLIRAITLICALLLPNYTFAKELNIAKAGDSIVVAAGMPSTETGGTNMLKIEKI